jgi:aryl-phospho-beta-D-glucosidase BglC (GH1 family)
MSFSELEITPRDGSKSIFVRPSNWDWGVKPSTFYLDANGVPDARKNKGMMDRKWLNENVVAPWKNLEKQGVGVLVGEWGAYNKTPHDVVLPWMRDCLENWKGAGWGWVLWNFRGDFGVLDSGRSDVKYENFKGHKLDREMLKILQAY